MAVTVDGTRRWIQVEADVLGSTEQIWRAIATGPGLGCWFFPSELEERVGGSLVCHMGPGMDANATVEEWDPPHRFLASSSDLGPDAPALRTEWTVEPGRVRVVHSLETNSDAWDGSLLGMEAGWPGFFRVLKLYLQHFADRDATPLCLMAPASGTLEEAWKRLTDSLPYEGTVEGILEGEGYRELLLRTEDPVPALVALNAGSAGEQVQVLLAVFHYADPPPDEPLWRSWLR